LGRHSA